MAVAGIGVSGAAQAKDGFGVRLGTGYGMGLQSGGGGGIGFLGEFAMRSSSMEYGLGWLMQPVGTGSTSNLIGGVFRYYMSDAFAIGLDVGYAMFTGVSGLFFGANAGYGFKLSDAMTLTPGLRFNYAMITPATPVLNFHLALGYHF